MESERRGKPSAEEIGQACRAMVSEHLSGNARAARERGAAIPWDWFAEAAAERCAAEIHLYFGFGDGGESLAAARAEARKIGASVARDLLERAGSEA